MPQGIYGFCLPAEPVPPNELQGVYQSRVLYNFLKSSNQSNSGIDSITKEQKIPDWLYLAGILILLTMDWLEPRWD